MGQVLRVGGATMGCTSKTGGAKRVPFKTAHLQVPWDELLIQKNLPNLCSSREEILQHGHNKALPSRDEQDVQYKMARSPLSREQLLDVYLKKRSENHLFSSAHPFTHA